MTQLQNQRNVTLSHVCVSMQSVQYCNSHLSHMDIFSGSNLVQQRAQTSPSSPTTSSSSLSSCVGAVHTCAGTCSHGPYGGYRTCLRIKNCCKCKSTRTYMHSRGSPKEGEQNQKSKPTPRVTMMHHATKCGFKDCPGFLNSTGRLGPKRGRKCYVTPAFSGVPKRRGTKSEVKTYAKGHHDAPRNKAWIQRLSRFPHSTGRLGAKRGRKCYVTLAFSGVPNKGGQNQKSKPTLRVTMMPLGAPSITKYGSLVRPDAQIVALRAHCA